MSALSLDDFLYEIRACKICEKSLPDGVRPVLRAGEISHQEARKYPLDAGISLFGFYLLAV